MRLGELLALQWEDLDFHGRLIAVQRNYIHGGLSSPKSGESRRVDMSLELCQTLRDLRTERQLEATANGWKMVPVWLFCNEKGELLDPDNLRHRGFYYLLDKAQLRKVRFHDLRHTFASLLLQQGESPVYVKEQMGHSSIQVTVDIYGHLIPGGNKAAVDRLDGPVDKSFPQVESATPAQPVGVGAAGDGIEVLDSTWCARQELNLRPAGSKSLLGHTETQQSSMNTDVEQDRISHDRFSMMGFRPLVWGRHSLIFCFRATISHMACNSIA